MLSCLYNCLALYIPRRKLNIPTTYFTKLPPIKSHIHQNLEAYLKLF